MLKEITFKNFKSYNKETTFSMEADYKRVKEHEDHYVDLCNNKILKISSIYGPNGGGKSNMISALSIFPALLKYDSSSGFRAQEIKNIFSNDEESELTAFFVDEEYEIGYNFKITFTIKTRSSR